MGISQTGRVWIPLLLRRPGYLLDMLDGLTLLNISNI